MDLRVTVVNGNSTPYTGTVVTGLPIPAKTMYGPIDIIGLDTSGTGKTYQASHEITTRYEDGSAKWVLTGVNGTFQPGETELTITPNFDGLYSPDRKDFFVPENYMPSTDAGVHVKYVDYDTGEEKEFILDFANLGTQWNYTHYSNETFMLFEWWGKISDTMGWRLFAKALKGEPGIRLEFILENLNKGFDDKGKPQIIKEAAVWHRQPKPDGDAPVFAWGEQFKQQDSWYGKLGIAHGKECCPLTMGYHDGYGVVYGQWITAETRIPQGGHYTPLTLPGEERNTGNSQLHPESDWGDYIWEKRSVEFFIGDKIEQEHLDHPPMVVWSDVSKYNDFIVGGIVPESEWKDSDGNPIEQSTLQRMDRRAAANYDPDACTPSSAGVNGERITLARFRERGGTYLRTPDKNPMYGSLNYGDKQWGSGKSGSAHYDIDHSFMYQFLRSRDFRSWKEAAIATKHYRTVDYAWAQDTMGATTQNKNEGKSTYEKGQQHGNYSLATFTHTWINGNALAYCLTGHPEHLRVCNQVAHHAVTHEHLDGGAVPSNWQFGSDLDPRDWGSLNARLYGTSTGGGAARGYQGDWGIRKIARCLEIATALKVYVGNEIEEDVDTYMLRVLSNTERIETGIWGGNGYILNRASRPSNRYDNEQGWMHAYVVRGIGYALIHGPTEAAEMYKGLYDRMYDHLLDLVVYGHKDQTTGHYVPPRLAARFDTSGVIAVTRYGLKSGTVSKWYRWRNSVQAGDYDKVLFDDWKASLLADYADMKSYSSPAGHHAWLLDRPDFKLYIETAKRVTFDISKDHADFIYLKSKQWAYTIDAGYANVNHCAIGADALAQGALEFGRQDGEIPAVRLSENAQWRLQQSGPRPIADLRIGASDVGFRMAMYPNSESKINGNQLEDHYQRRLIAQMDKITPIWDDTISDVPDEVKSNPWVNQEADEIESPMDIEGRVDMISSDPSVEGSIQVVTSAVLDGNKAPDFMREE